MSWIAIRADCQRLITVKTPIIWGKIQDALEQALKEFKTYYHETAPISVVDMNRNGDYFRATFQRERGSSLHAPQVILEVKVRYPTHSEPFSVIDVTWPQTDPSVLTMIWTFKIERCDSEGPIIESEGVIYTPESLSEAVLKGPLFGNAS